MRYSLLRFNQVARGWLGAIGSNSYIIIACVHAHTLVVLPKALIYDGDL